MNQVFKVKVYFKDFHLICKTVVLRNSFSLTPLDGYWQLLNLFWSEICRFISVYGSKIQNIPKKSVVKTLLNILLTVKKE